MGEGDLFVQLDAEAGLLRRDDEAILPADRLFEDLSVEAVPALDAFEDEKVRAARRELDVGRADDRPAIEMRRDLRVMRFGHGGDLLGFENAPDPAQIHLQDRGGAGLEHAGELVLCRQPLAGRDRDAALRRDPGHLLRRLGRGRLLEP